MTQKFTINNFKQELKDLAQLQHDEKLFFKHPEKYPYFIKEHEEALQKEYEKFHEYELQYRSIPCRLKSEYKENLAYQVRESQTQCNKRRIILSRLYEDYYALKHWKKLNIDDDKSMVKYFFLDYLEDCDQQNSEAILNEKIEKLSEKTFIDNSPEGNKVYKELKNMYREKLLTTSEYYAKEKELKRISWFEHKKNELLNYTDKEE